MVESGTRRLDSNEKLSESLPWRSRSGDHGVSAASRRRARIEYWIFLLKAKNGKIVRSYFNEHAMPVVSP